jgi:hypothetical protein
MSHWRFGSGPVGSRMITMVVKTARIITNSLTQSDSTVQQATDKGETGAFNILKDISLTLLLELLKQSGQFKLPFNFLADTHQFALLLQ